MDKITSNEVSSNLLSAYQMMSGWELIAVILALAYLLLAMKERIECWYAAFASTVIYTFLFWDVNLLMESALQLYYLVMAVYGWRQWRRSNAVEQTTVIQKWAFSQHLYAILLLFTLTIISGYLLQKNTSAAWPYIDSFTTWGSVITTYMVTKKVLENWLYWILIDTVSIFLYIDRELYLTALLFVFYVIIVLFGYLSWSKKYHRQNEPIIADSHVVIDHIRQ